MKLNAWHTLAAVVLLLIAGCGASTASVLPRETDPAAPASQAKLTTLQKLERDYMAEQLLVEADAIAREISKSKSGTAREHYERLVRRYVPVYMASVCIEGSEPSAQDFIAVTRAALSAGKDPEVEEFRIIKALEYAQDKRNSESLDATMQSCLQPYLYPESISDASPAVELLITSKYRVSPFFRDSFESSVRSMAAEWFQTDQQESFVSWMCNQSMLTTRCGP